MGFIPGQFGGGSGSGGAGGGGIGGTVGTTDNAVPRADGTTGDALQGSTVTIDDNGRVNFPERLISSSPTGNYVGFGDSQFGDVLADGNSTVQYNGGGKRFQVRSNLGTIDLAVDASATAGQTRLLVWDVDNGTLERVTVGAADSGGAGFKVLRIPN